MDTLHLAVTFKTQQQDNLPRSDTLTVTIHVPIKTDFYFSQKNTCELLVRSPGKEKDNLQCVH